MTTLRPETLYCLTGARFTVGVICQDGNVIASAPLFRRRVAPMTEARLQAWLKEHPEIKVTRIEGPIDARRNLADLDVTLEKALADGRP